MASFEPQETCATTKFCCQLNYSLTETFEMIKQTCAANNLSQTQVFEWRQHIHGGRLSIEDDGEGFHKSSMDTASVTAVIDVVYSDRLHLCTLTVRAHR